VISGIQEPSRPGRILVLRPGGGGESRAPRRDQPAGEDAAPAERCVLVVEDESDALDSIVELLEGEGYRAVGAHNGQEALDALRSGLHPRLILLDLKMPVMDGWDFCAVLAGDRDFAEIPIAIVTASASLPTLPVRRRDAGFFVKPINFERLLRTVRQICG
jgi:CheY-like chemotaxis protein